MADERISVGGFIHFSIESLKVDWLKFIGLGLLAVAAFIVCGAVSGWLMTVHVVLGVLAAIVAMVVEITVMFGFLKNVLNLCRGQAVDLGAFIRVKPVVILYFIVASAIVGAAVIFGLVMFALPGIILVYLLSLTPYLIIDREIGPIKAIDESYRLTKGHLLDVFVVTFVGTAVLGLFSVFIITLIITVPMMCLMWVYLYLHLTGQLEAAKELRAARAAADSAALASAPAATAAPVEPAAPVEDARGEGGQA